MSNIYYDPEEWNLDLVCQVEYSDGEYQFDIRAVWKDKSSGSYYTGRDSGCSCPLPFEDYRQVSDLLPLNVKEIRTEALNEVRGYNRDDIHRFLDGLSKIENDLAMKATTNE